MRRANGPSSAGVQFDSKLRFDRTACAERKHRGPQGLSERGRSPFPAPPPWCAIAGTAASAVRPKCRPDLTLRPSRSSAVYELYVCTVEMSY